MESEGNASSGGGKHQEGVFCTTDLGLNQSTKQDDGSIQTQVLVKARVILISELEEILRDE